MIDNRRKSNGRYRDASAQLALCRLHWGRYRSASELAADMGVGEVTVRDWLRWWREAWAVYIDRGEDGILTVVESGAVDMLRLRAWIESGHAFNGAEHMGVRYGPGHTPWIDREWPEVPRGGVAPVFRFIQKAAMPVRPVAVVPPSADDEPLRDDELPI